MSAYMPKEELALLAATRVSHPQHIADARDVRPARTGLVSRIRAWLQRQSTLAELNSLTDRELADIGLNRAELVRVFEPALRARRA